MRILLIEINKTTKKYSQEKFEFNPKKSETDISERRKLLRSIYYSLFYT
jgi:hypothetical protein